ncbi:ABC transporter ATP-binding protein [Glycomyces algeriensis]|uniref:Multidrug ABC transporter ATP-binding protein n=1 Tax=Glycomyces algeriensis TaxID=256037 RepID=A0A9W6G8W5_9ACTN|nr:ABC transporter ATP-binding protein [Glycomyces algeriensis]MDA1365114.1 ABC transporter ATP-binding protein [Glycomyces algeriensis]MDR7349824.1 ABC-2 type transport system ATP-binding protein [Glycomyces algeriensis]GLI42535.1 multidrug ABC transporter ATP-binding protein [Glycomyces algeriensis]
MPPIIEISGLRKTYSRAFRQPHNALDGLDLEVAAGQVHGFLGPNGSGKTTTLRALLGLIRVDGGTMRIFGEEVPRRLPEVVGRIGAVVESPQFFKHFSGRLTLQLLAESAGVSKARVEEVLEQVGLRDAAKASVKGYSLGMRQRLAVAQALLKQPQLLILDEPANGLDPAGIHHMRELLQWLAHSQGVTVVVSSHLLSEVQQLCDSMTIVSRGRRIVDGKVADIIAGHGDSSLTVRFPDVASLPEAAEALAAASGSPGAAAVSAAVDRDRLVVRGAPEAAWVTRTLADAGIYLSELRMETKNLESVFLELTGTAPVPGQTVQIGESVVVPQGPPVAVSDGVVSIEVESEGAER